MAGDPHPFLVPPERWEEGVVLFSDEEAHHVLRVVRIKPGERCRVVDGIGGRFLVRLEGGVGGLRGIVLESSREEKPLRRLDLGFPMLRLRARTEWLIEKAVEVGVDRFVPIAWERGLKEVSSSARSRWDRIAREAMKQCERAWLPALVREIRPADAGNEPMMMILADPCGPEFLPDLTDAASVLFLVGPEGGVTDAEKEVLLGAGARTWSLGPTRLRAETAAIVGSHRLAGALRMSGSPAADR